MRDLPQVSAGHPSPVALRRLRPVSDSSRTMRRRAEGCVKIGSGCILFSPTVKII